MDCANPEAKCDKHSDNAGQKCGAWFAYPYFISFYIICSFLVRRVYAAVVLLSYIYTSRIQAKAGFCINRLQSVSDTEPRTLVKLFSETSLEQQELSVLWLCWSDELYG